MKGAVFDRWWPHRRGVVVRKTKTRTWVQWFDGEVWKYDGAHARKFLQPC